MRYATSIPILGAEPLRECRGCGCDDDNACQTEHGPCAWVLLDLPPDYLARRIQGAARAGAGIRTGICSCCAIEAGFDPRAYLDMGRERLAAARPALVLP